MINSYCRGNFTQSIKYCIQCTEHLKIAHFVTQISLKSKSATTFTNDIADLDLTLSPCKTKKPALPTITNSLKAEISACRSMIYSHKAEISAWKFKKNLLQIMLCLGAPGLGTPYCRNTAVRGLKLICTVPGALADRLRFNEVVGRTAASVARHVFFAGFGFRLTYSRLRG